MPVPKKRHSTARQGKRRAAHRYILPRLLLCPNCNSLIPPHMVCPSCHMYKGKSFAIIEEPKKETPDEKSPDGKMEDGTKQERHHMVRKERSTQETIVQKIGRVHRKPDSS